MELGKILNHPDDFEQAKLLFEISIDLLPRQTLPILLLVKHLIKGAKSQEDGTIYYAPDFETSKNLLQKAHQINPNDPAVIPTARKKINSNTDMYSAFSNKN